MKKSKAVSVLLALFVCATAAFAQGTLADQYRAGMLPRFVEYTKIASQSDNDAEWMTPGQEEMAQILYKDIQAFGFPTYLSKDKYIYVNIPSNLKGRKAPVLGISAHYDTTPDIIGYGIKPQVIKNYDGKPIELKNGHVINFETDPYLQKMVGKTIVTSDGTTMLGADDKAGVTIVTTLIKTLAENPDMPHGQIQLVITPNEDVGRSAERLDLNYYHPDYAFDFDAGWPKASTATSPMPKKTATATRPTRLPWLPAWSRASTTCPTTAKANKATLSRTTFLTMHKPTPTRWISAFAISTRTTANAG